MPKSKQRKKAAKKAKHYRRNPNDSYAYLRPDQIKHNNDLRKSRNH